MAQKYYDFDKKIAIISLLVLFISRITNKWAIELSLKLETKVNILPLLIIIFERMIHYFLAGIFTFTPSFKRYLD